MQEPIDEHNIENSGRKVISRRLFFKKASGILTIFGSVVVGVPLVGSLVDMTQAREEKKFIKIVNLDLLPEDVPQKINFSEPVTDTFIIETQNNDVWIMKDSSGSVTVFSPVCPHLGCSYEWQPQQKLFFCPCHSSVFNKEGKVISGPSPRGLDSLKQKIVNGELYIIHEKFEIGIPQKVVI